MQPLFEGLKRNVVCLLGFILLLSLASCSQSVLSVSAEDLETLNTPVIAGNPLDVYTVTGDTSRLTVTKVAVTGQTFTQAWRFTTSGTFQTPYEVQLYATNTAPVIQDDVLTVQFWARAVGSSATARTEFTLENGQDYSKSILAGVHFGRSWKFFQATFKAHQNFAIGEAFALFRLGYNNQSFELADVRLLNYSKTRSVQSIPSRGFEYPGIDLNAPWRAAANARINQYRKANLAVHVVDINGNPVSGATVNIAMQRHAFPFGSAVGTYQFLNNATYRHKVYKLFNRAVLESELKWVPWEDYSRNDALKTIDMLRQNGLSVRGHNLLWPIKDKYILPEDLFTLTPAQLRERIDLHLQDIVTATKGKLVEWDVVNEPSANKYLQDILGEDEMAVWYKRVKALDPNTRLFINDYGNLGEGNLDTEYKRIIRRLLALGAPVEGIGLQAHFSWELTPPEELYSRLTDFGRIGPTLAITEFDVGITDEQLQAAYLRDALTVAFSHPQVSSFLMWGFWEGQHWKPEAALYRQNWSLKPNGKIWNDLIFKEWWTNDTGLSNGTGDFSTRGFLGKYKLTASKGSQTVSQTVTLQKTGNTFVLTLR